jgi:hypothetical protein
MMVSKLKIRGKSLKSEGGYYSCWYNRLQGALYLLAFLTFGIGDTITSIWMIGQRGIIGEGNPFMQYVFLNYGIPNYIAIKICVTVVLLFVPFLLLDKAAYWMISGYLVSFIVAGTIGTVLNIQAARNERLLLSPEQVIFLFITLVLVLTSIGEEIDKRTKPKIRPYVACLLNDIAIILITITSIFKKKE